MIRIKDKKWFFKGIKILILALIVVFWFIYLRRNWGNLGQYDWAVNWTLASLSLGFFLMGYLLLGFLWAPLRFEITGQRMSPVNAFRVSAMAWMGRYVPGKIWALAGKVYLSTSDKNQIASVGTAVIVETLLFEVSGLLLAMIILPFCSNVIFMPGSAIIIGCVLIVVSLLLVHPKVFCPVVNRFLKIVHQPPINHSPRYRIMLLIMLGYMCVFALWGTAFTIFAHSVTPLGFSNLPLIVAIFSISWVFGYLVLVAPAGLGVRESILTVALQSLLPVEASIIILVAASRVLTTLAEMLCLLLALVVNHLSYQIHAVTEPKKKVKVMTKQHKAVQNISIFLLATLE